MGLLFLKWAPCPLGVRARRKGPTHVHHPIARPPVPWARPPRQASRAGEAALNGRGNHRLQSRGDGIDHPRRDPTDDGVHEAPRLLRGPAFDERAHHRPRVGAPASLERWRTTSGGDGVTESEDLRACRAGARAGDRSGGAPTWWSTVPVEEEATEPPAGSSGNDGEARGTRCRPSAREDAAFSGRATWDPAAPSLA